MLLTTRTTLRVKKSTLGIVRIMLRVARTILRIELTPLRVERRPLSFARNKLGLMRGRLSLLRAMLSLVRMLFRVERATLGTARQVLVGWKSTVDSTRATLQHSANFMTRDDLNRTDMFNTVDSLMDKNQSIWGVVPAITVTVADVKAGIAAIGESVRRQQSPTGGARDEKVAVRLSFEEKILEIADQLSALAAKNKDANLGAQVELTLSALDKQDVDVLEQTGKRVSGLATPNLAALADYGITQADVTELNNLTTKFHGVKNAPRTAISGRAGETDTQPGLVANVTSILRNRLDKQMTKFKKSHPEFFAAYRSARVIVDRGGSGGGSQPPPAPTPKPPQ